MTMCSQSKILYRISVWSYQVGSDSSNGNCSNNNPIPHFKTVSDKWLETTRTTSDYCVLVYVLCLNNKKNNKKRENTNVNKRTNKQKQTTKTRKRLIIGTKIKTFKKICLFLCIRIYLWYYVKLRFLLVLQ